MRKGPGRSTAYKIIDKVVLGKHNNRGSWPKGQSGIQSFFSNPELVFKETALLIDKKEQKNSP